MSPAVIRCGGGLVATAMVLLACACGPALRPPLKPIYRHAELPAGAGEVRLDVPYRSDPAADPAKHRLDLFLPATDGWPLLVFVHGGSLERGDTSLTVAGHDIYRNIGRFYAARGVGVALVNYRLQPGVNWVAQADDVASAVAWLLGRVASLGGDGRMYLSGHSAGSWLVGHVGLDEEIHRRHGIDPRRIAGIISVSGSGFDLTDERTWELFGSERRWRRRFSVAPGDTEWKRSASILPHLRVDSPPFLLLYSAGEWPALVRQNRLMCSALELTDAGCRMEEIDGLGHRRMLLAISHEGRPVARRILDELGARVTSTSSGAPPVAQKPTGDRLRGSR